MAWRLAKSLAVLRKQLNEAYPNRDKKSDGTIGDQSHANSRSDHNPNPQGVVCAYDIDSDLNAGFDAHELADYMRLHRHPDLKYIVSKDRICSRRDGWAWRKYSGDYHGNHIHVSVGVGPDGFSVQPYDDTIEWQLLEGEGVSTDALTKEEIIVIIGLALNDKPNDGTYNAYLGKPLSPFLTDLVKFKTLQKQVQNKELIKPSECPTNTNVDALYDAQIVATKKVFGK